MWSNQQPNLRNDLRAIRKSAFRTTFLAVLLVSGIAPAFCMWWDYRADLDWSQQFAGMWGVALRTYPLTISVAIIAMSRQLGWFRYGRVFFMGAVITAGASLSGLAATWLGRDDQVVRAANVINAPDHMIFGPLVNSFNYLAGYYELYGASHFFAAILVGGFAGRAACRLIRHVPNRAEVGAVVVEQVRGEVTRRAA